MIRGALLDLAGVVYDGDHALPGALSATERLRQAGLSLRFVTNTTRMPKRKVLGRLAKLGLDIEESELFTPGRRRAIGSPPTTARRRCSSIPILWRSLRM